MKKTHILDLMAVAVTGNIMLFAAMFRKPETRWRRTRYDCCMVCGYPAGNDGSVSPIMKSRVEKGIDIYKKGFVKTLLFSGGAVQNEYREAEVMKAYAMGRGVPEEVILTETDSGSTYANMKLSLPIIRRNNIENLIVVTNDWHLRKADHYARKMKVEYVMVSADRPEGETTCYNFWLRLTTNVSMYLNLWKGLY